MCCRRSVCLTAANSGFLCNFDVLVRSHDNALPAVGSVGAAFYQRLACADSCDLLPLLGRSFIAGSCMQIENAVLQKAGELQRQRREGDEDAAGVAAEDAVNDAKQGRHEGGAAGGAVDAAGDNTSKAVPDVVRFH